MKTNFITGEFCRFPNEEIPHILGILRANGHPLWKSTSVYQRDQDIISCSTDGDLMGYWSKEPECNTELSRHDFMCKALRLEEGMGISSKESTRKQRSHIYDEMTRLGINVFGDIHGTGFDPVNHYLFYDGCWLSTDEDHNYTPYIDWCKRLCVEPIGQSSQDMMNEVLPDSHPMKEATPEMTGANIYPLTIVSDRYNGAYSGALFLAFNLDTCDIPYEIGAGDGDEMAFYEGDGHKKYKIGKGRTANDAAANLYCILNTPEFNASMLEVGEFMETIEFAGERQLIKRISQNNWIEYLNGHDSFGRLLAEELKGCKVDVEIKVREL